MTNFLGSSNSRYYAVAHSSRLIVGKEDGILWQKEIPFDEYELLALGANGYLFLRSPEGIHVFDLKGDLIYNPIPRWSRHELASNNAYLGAVRVSGDGRRLMIEKVSLQARLSQRLFELLSSTRVEPDTLLHEIYTYNLDDDTFRFFYRSKCQAALQKNQRFLWNASVDHEWVSFVEPERADRLRLSVANLGSQTIEHEFTIPALRVEAVRVGRDGTTLLDATQGDDRGLVVIGTDGVHHPLTSTASARILHLGANFVAVRTAPVPFLLVKGFDDRLMRQADLRALDKIGLCYDILFNERDSIDVVTLAEGTIKVLHSNLDFLETDSLRWERLASGAEAERAGTASPPVQTGTRPDQRRSAPIEAVSRDAQTYDSFLDLFVLSGTEQARAEEPPPEAPPAPPTPPLARPAAPPARRPAPRLEVPAREGTEPTEDLKQTRRLPSRSSTGGFVETPRTAGPPPFSMPEPEEPRSVADEAVDRGEPGLYYDPVMGWTEEPPTEPGPAAVPELPGGGARFPGAPVAEPPERVDAPVPRPVLLRRSPGSSEGGDAPRSKRQGFDTEAVPRPEHAPASPPPRAERGPVSPARRGERAPVVTERAAAPPPEPPQAPAAPVLIERPPSEGGRRPGAANGRGSLPGSGRGAGPTLERRPFPPAGEGVSEKSPSAAPAPRTPAAPPASGAPTVAARPPAAPPPRTPAAPPASSTPTVASPARSTPAAPPASGAPTVAARPPASSADAGKALTEPERKRVQRLLDMLEDRFKQGQVTEAVYKQLKAKYLSQLG